MADVAFPVLCSDPDRLQCRAKYKIAAEWVGHGFRELKTFGFADDECLQRVYLSALRRAARIRVVEGERLGEVGIYLLDPRAPDAGLSRMPQLENALRSQ